MSEQEAHANNLKASRTGSFKNSLRNARKSIATARNAASLMSYFGQMMDFFLILALIAAMLKDIVDLFSNALLALGGLGQIIIMVSTMMASSIIGLAIFATNSSSNLEKAKRFVGKNKNAIYQKLMTLGGATLAEFIPGVDTLPLESITVFYIILLTLRQRRRDAENKIQADEQLQTEANLNSRHTSEQQFA